MSEDELGALVPEMNCQLQQCGSKQHDRLEGTVGRRHVRGARAPVLPRVILRACFDPYTKRLWIAKCHVAGSPMKRFFFSMLRTFRRTFEL